jgi:hypothetical protein
VDDELGPGGERFLRDGVHVSDDHVRPEAGVEQRVGASVHAHEHRSQLSDVRPQDREVLFVVVAPHDDEHMASVEVGLDIRKAGGLDQHVPLLA